MDRDLLLNLNARLRTLESRFGDFRELINFLRSNIQDLRKSLNEISKDAGSEVRTVERRLDDFERSLEVLKNEVTLRAPKEDFDVLKKYLDYWNPTNFVTIDQLDEILADLKSEKKIKK
ncbi:hypothetical protein HZA97_10255 [Candidatus Woesearchaeota archaeon]|nr:hypothetical protein [Candidatus Woesearchaeota archaeon]